ncbi:MAG: hypothetical protein ACJAS9_001411 [Polaribacter sp.]|jgi:hypothetical protein
MILVLIFFSKAAISCSCSAGSIVENWNKYEHIYLAKAKAVYITETGNYEQNISGNRLGELQVLNIYKGFAASPYLESSDAGLSCEMSIREGKDYFVFSNGEQKVHYSTCSPTRVKDHFPQFSTILQNLKNGNPLITLNGRWDDKKKELILESTKKVIKLLNASAVGYGDNKTYDISFTAFKLENGEIFAVELVNVVPVDEKS